MLYDPLNLGPSNIIKKGIELRIKSEMYKECNEAVGLPNLITQEVYRIKDKESEELVVEILCTRHIDIKKRIEYYTVKRVLKDMGFGNQKFKTILEGK